MRRWIPCTATAFVIAGLAVAHAGPTKRLDENFDDAFEEVGGNFNLRFFDAVTGFPIPGASVEFEGVRGTTDAEGAVNFAIPGDLSDDDRRTATFQRKGYIQSRFKVEFLSGALFFNRYSVSPSLAEGPIRVVLDWRKSPRDLDAHLVKVGSYHISYRDKRRVEDQAWLDRDDQDGFGPETITIEHPDDGATYRFFVHDYSNQKSRRSKALANSRAHVLIFSNNGLLQSFSVPRGAAGTTWTVFEIVQGEIRASNEPMR